MDKLSGLTLRQAALTAGFAYLTNPVIFAEAYAMPRLVSPDAEHTLANLRAHPHLFVAAILCYVFSLVGDVVIAWTLYVLLAPVNRAGSLLSAWLRLVYAAVSLSAALELVNVHRLITRPALAGLFSQGGLRAQVMLGLAAFRADWSLGLVLFGLHLVVLGWLIFRSTYAPRWLGALLFLDGWAWVVDNLSVYLFPEARLGWLHAVFGVELVLMVWLLGWGWRLPEVPPATNVCKLG